MGIGCNAKQNTACVYTEWCEYCQNGGENEMMLTNRTTTTTILSRWRMWRRTSKQANGVDALLLACLFVVSPSIAHTRFVISVCENVLFFSRASKYSSNRHTKWSNWFKWHAHNENKTVSICWSIVIYSVVFGLPLIQARLCRWNLLFTVIICDSWSSVGVVSLSVQSSKQTNAKTMVYYLKQQKQTPDRCFLPNNFAHCRWEDANIYDFFKQYRTNC